MKPVSQRIHSIAKSIRTTRRIYAGANRLLAKSIAMMLLSITICLFALKPAYDSRFTLNQYVPVTNQGQPIKAIRGHVEHMSEEAVADWVTQCAQQALSFSPPSYKRDFMAFVERCMPSTSITDWGKKLERSGYLKMAKSGSILEFTPEKTELINNRVIDGRRYWRFRVKGELLRYLNGTYRSDVSLDIVVARQDPFNFKQAISINRIVL